jgi:phosphoribosylanthranilate isomerase
MSLSDSKAIQESKILLFSLLDSWAQEGASVSGAISFNLLCGVPAIRVADIETDPETGKAPANAADNLLESLSADPVAILLDTSLDTSIKGAKAGGGTGVTFDWSIAENIQNVGLPVMIAGGLTPENVQDAVESV